MSELMNLLEKYLYSSPIIALGIVFIGGILVSFTPCVYPLIPITIAVIGSGGAGSKLRAFAQSFFYVLGFATMYSALGAFAALSGRMFGEIGSSPWPYVIVANICIILSLMLFDIIPFKIPFANKIYGNRPSGKGILAIYIAGIISGLVAGPCVAAPLGVVLAFVAAKHNVIYGMGLLFSFSMGMGVLLMLVGTFAGILSALPKPGPWMDRIKKVFAFLFLIIGEILLIKAGGLW